MMRFVVLAILTLTGCGGGPPDLAVHTEAENEHCRAAPLAIVGVIESDEEAAPGRTADMQLRRLRIRMENVLRGKALLAGLTGPAITVYYFKFGSGYTGPRPLGTWDEQSMRRVFWLEQTAGIYRTSCDGRDDCTIGIHSGAHPGYQIDPGKTVEQAIVDLGLTRGARDANDKWFASSIENSAPPDDSTRDYFIEKLKTLSEAERGPVREAACKLLVRYASACRE